MTYIDKNTGLIRGWYHHRVGERCDNCRKGFWEGEGVLNANTLAVLCYDCYYKIYSKVYNSSSSKKKSETQKKVK